MTAAGARKRAGEFAQLEKRIKYLEKVRGAIFGRAVWRLVVLVQGEQRPMTVPALPGFRVIYPPELTSKKTVRRQKLVDSGR